MKLIKLGFTMPPGQVSPQTLKDFWQPRSALQTRDMSQCLSLAKVTTLFSAECRGALGTSLPIHILQIYSYSHL